MNNILREPAVRGDEQACKHIKKLIETEQEYRKIVARNRDINRQQLINTLKTRHNATRELEERSGVKRSLRPRSILENNKTSNNPPSSSRTSITMIRTADSKIIDKLKKPKDVNIYKIIDI